MIKCQFIFYLTYGPPLCYTEGDVKNISPPMWGHSHYLFAGQTMITRYNKYFNTLNKEERFLIFMGSDYILKGLELRKCQWKNTNNKARQAIIATWEKCFRLSIWTII